MRDQKPVSLSDDTLLQLKQLAHLMDGVFTFPGTNIRFGLDSIIGVLPIIGDTLSVAISGYIYSFAKDAGVPFHRRVQMIWNIFIDWLIGIIPFLGDIFDVAYKANTKNLKIIINHVEKQKNADIIEGAYERID